MAVFSDSLFQANMGTQFESPYEGMYMNSPGWSMNSAYMSPSYMGNFRPDYGGFSGFNPNNIPSFSMTGAMATASGMNSSPYYINPLAYRDAALDHLTTAPADAGMWSMQNIATPLAAFGIGSAISGMNMPSFLGTSAAQQVSGNLAARAGMSGRTAGAYWQTYVTGSMTQGQLSRHNAATARFAAAAGNRQSLGAFMGSRLGSGFGAVGGRMAGGAMGAVGGGMGRFLGLGGGMTSGAMRGSAIGARALAGAGGAVGAAAGSLFTPFLLASGITEVANEAIFDPYIAARRGREAARANFAGAYTGSSNYGTLGIDRSSSAQIGTALAQVGYEDRAFGSEGGINIFDMSMKSGLMSEVGNLDPAQIKKQVKNISKQVQAIMAVAGDPDVSRAIQTLAKMKKMGISGNDANTTIQALGAAEAISGTSSAQIMNTVGTQTSYMFQQAGIAPQGAMQAAASSYAGFANAYKMGLINPTTLAMMGGTEGATQSLLSGQIGLGRSMYNQISLANRFMYGGSQNGVVDNLSMFGQNVANNPLAAFGAVKMNAGAMMGAQMQENPLAPTQGIFDMLKNMPGVTGADGKVRWDTFAGAGLSMGMSEDQMRALLEQMKMYQDPAAMGRMTSASFAKARERYASYLEREGLDWTTGGGVIGTMGSGMHKGGLWLSDMKGGMATMFGNMSEGAGRYIDAAGRSFYNYLGADPGTQGIMSEDAYVQMFTKGTVAERQGYNIVDGTAGTTLSTIADTAEGAGYLGSIFASGLRSADSVLNDASSNNTIIRKVERKVNESAVSEEEYARIMALPSFQRNVALQKTFGLSATEAATYSRIGPPALSLARDTVKESSADLLNEPGNIGAVSQALMGVRRNAKPRTSSSSGRNSLLAGMPKAGTNLYDDRDAIQGLDLSGRLTSLSIANQLLEDPSKVMKYLAENEGTPEGEQVKGYLATLLGKSTVTDEDIVKFNNRSYAEKTLGGVRSLLGENADLRSFVNAAGDDFNSLLTEEGIDKVARKGYQMRRVASSIGLGGLSVGNGEELSKLSDIERAAYENQIQIESMASTGRLDFTGYLEATNANKMSVSTDKFSKAVDLFYRAATGEAPPSGGSLSLKGDTP